jgi:hypothetical protein
MLARLGLAEDLERWRAVEEWEAIVGASLARYAKAIRVDRDVLVVEAANPAAMHHVSHYRREMLERLERHLGARRFQDVRFVLSRTTE